MVQHNSVKYTTGCQPIDEILGGGLKRGCVLELSGPPGASKEAITIDTTRAFVEDGQAVLFVGSIIKSSWDISPSYLN